MPAERVLLIEPRGFCAGVDMAIKALAWMVALHDGPVCCVHAIVHNDAVVERFERLGVVFVDDVSQVASGQPVVLSAHGSAPSAVARAHETSAFAVDAVCPLVAKVHHEIRTRAAAGIDVLYVGHPGHDEAEAALAVVPDATTLVATPADVAGLAHHRDAPVALVAQTTLSIDRLDAVERAVRERFSDVWTPRRSDLCYATTNRQRALRAACAHADAVVVVGSRSSANTAALVALARDEGVRAVRVDGAHDLREDLGGVVAVTAGASAPDDAVRAVVRALAPARGVERFAPITEAAYFPLPRRLHAMVAQAVAQGRVDECLVDAFRRDREIDPFELLRRVEAVRDRALVQAGVA